MTARIARIIRLPLAALLCLSFCAPAFAIDEDAEAALKDAVQTLRDQYIEARTAGSEGPKDSDYFEKDGKALRDKLDAATIVAALGERLCREPAVDAFVKWQLLSAIDGKIPDDLADAATQAYLNAPPPEPMPGIDQRDAMKLKQALQGMKKSQLPKMEKQWDRELLRRTGGNRAILGYRNKLHEKLPVTAGSLRAALQDAYQRVQAGLEPKKVVEAVIGDARSWAPDAPEAEVRAVAQLMYYAAGQQGPKVFRTVKWSARSKSIYFSTRSYKLDEELRSVAEEIVAMNQGGGVLHLK